MKGAGVYQYYSLGTKESGHRKHLWSCLKMPLRTRAQCFEAIKLFLAVLVGFSIRLAIESSSKQSLNCPVCPEKSVDSNWDLLHGDHSDGQLREPFRPRNQHEVLRFQYFNSSYIHDNFDETPRTQLLGHQKADIKDILDQTMVLYNAGRIQPYVLERLVNGYRRYDPLRGEEYVMDLELSAKTVHTKNNLLLNTEHEVQRVEVVKPFGVAHLIGSHTITNSKMIHFILPVNGPEHADRFLSFLRTYENVCLKSREYVYLMIVLFMGKTPDERSQSKTLVETVEKLGRQYRSAHIRVIQTSSTYSRELGIDLGMKQLPPEMLVFFCDIDIYFTLDFLNRCRHNAIRGKQVYYPIIFSQYNPEMIRKFSQKGEVTHLLDINKHTGHWVHYGFQLACMFSLDYRSVGGLNLDHHNAKGGEDSLLFNKHVESKLSIFRAMDPGLIHIFQRETCDPSAPDHMQEICLRMQLETFASKTQLAHQLLQQESSSARKSSFV